MFRFQTPLNRVFLIDSSMGAQHRYYKRKLYFSTPDRILLHLLDFVGREGEFNQPDDLTQFGVADAIGLGRSTVSKAIRKIAKDHMVRAQRAHVPSGKLRRTVYLLTPEGVGRATRRKLEVEEEVVAFRDPNGEERRLRVGQIPSLLPEYATLLDVASHVSEGVFDLASFRGRRGKRLVDFTERVPRLRYFFGRDRELTDMDAWLDSPSERVLVISGLTGIGKTTLLARKLEDWREKRHVFFHRIMPWTTLRKVALQLAEFLTRLSKKELSHYLEATQAVDIEQFVNVLTANLNGIPAVLIYDDYHAAEPGIRDFFYALRSALETTEGVKVVVSGRHVPPFYDRRDVRVKRIVKEIALGGLDVQSAQKLLETRNLELPRDALDSLFRQTGGHPLFLELVDFGTGSVVGDIHKYLNEELFSKVTNQEAGILTFASVFRYPVPADALYALDGVDPATLEGLVEQSLLREVSTKVFDVHDIVRSFFVEMSVPRDRKRFHKMAAQHYLSTNKPDPLEALYHLVESEEITGAARLAVKEGRDILKRETEQLLGLLDRLLPLAEDPAHGIELRLLRGHALDIRGELDGAVSVYQEVLAAASAPELGRKAAEAHHQLGDICRRRGDRRAAEEHLEAGLRMYRAAQDNRGQAEVLHALGQLMEDQGDLARAGRFYDRARGLARNLGIRDLEAHLEMAAARELATRGDYQSSLDRKQRALALAESLGDWHLLAKIHIAFGTVYYLLKRYSEAAQSYDRGIEMARRIGNLRMLAFGLFNAAGVLIRDGSDRKGEVYLKEAGSLFQKLRDPVMEAKVLQYEGSMWAKRGKWGLGKEKFKESLARLRSLSSPVDLAQTLYSFSYFCHKNGETQEAVRCLNEAEPIARRLSLSALLEEMGQYRDLYGRDGVPRPPESRSPDATPSG